MPRASSLGWSTEIERAAERADRPAMEMFFELWDAFRATRQEAQLPQDARHQASDEPEEPAARD